MTYSDFLAQDRVYHHGRTFLQHQALRDGEPCKHSGCLSHISHPCEGCGRIGGRLPEPEAKTLETLVEEARNRPFPKEERQAQRLSFAYGNAKLSNDFVTRDMVAEADAQIRKGSDAIEK